MCDASATVCVCVRECGHKAIRVDCCCRYCYSSICLFYFRFMVHNRRTVVRTYVRTCTHTHRDFTEADDDDQCAPFARKKCICTPNAFLISTAAVGCALNFKSKICDIHFGRLWHAAAPLAYTQCIQTNANSAGRAITDDCESTAVVRSVYGVHVDQPRAHCVK